MRYTLGFVALVILSLGAASFMGIVLAAPSSSPVADFAIRGDRDAVRTLLQQGADVNAAQGDGMTALHWAGELGDAEMAEMLVYAGANVEAETRIGHYTPLHVACRTGNAAVAEILLEAGSDAMARTMPAGSTAASSSGRSR